MEYTHRRLGPVYTHVCLQVALGSERAAADLTLERPFTRVRTVVHL